MIQVGHSNVQTGEANHSLRSNRFSTIITLNVALLSYPSTPNGKMGEAING